MDSSFWSALAYTLAGALGSSVAFGVVVNYVLKKLDTKVSKETFNEHCRRMEDAFVSIRDNFISGQKHFRFLTQT